VTAPHAPVVTTHLELMRAADLRPPAGPPPAGLRVTDVHDPRVNRDLYARVGAGWSWTDRLGWSAAAWAAHADRVETWLASVDGEPAGYYELDVPDATSGAEIAMFGLLGAYRGQGLGGHLLTHAIRRGLARAPRVWVHTCTLDGPHALANYEARGMRAFRTEVEPPA
jgi:GNAT superfamily N-acetyltransferase